MKKEVEINRGYVDYLRAMNQVGVPSSAAFPSALRLKAAISVWWKQGITVLGLLALTFLLEVWLRLCLIPSRSKLSPLNQAAIDNVNEFVEQYPFHLYPVVCKAFELACLKAELPKLLDQRSNTLEVAIGDGTFSSRVFPPDAKVVGLDLSPYSLKKASEKPHVELAIVCDCRNPPVREGSFDVLVANNFLHHVTNKEQTLFGWSRIAERAVFNENSPTWASGWPVPYVLKKLGRSEDAARAATQIERLSLQSLESKASLDARIAKAYEIIQCASYVSEPTFFYCGLFSFVMRCYGPPTPSILKQLFLSRRLRWLVLPLTANLAKLLIRYDQHQDRSTDSFVSYICKSQNFVSARAGNYLACPNCRGELTQTNRCPRCRKEYSYTDGMLFLLPEELEDLQREYNLEISAQTPKEHL